MHVIYPSYQKEIVRLGKEDQTEVLGHYQVLKQLESEDDRNQHINSLKAHCHTRAERMMEILREIKEPTISNIGDDGSEMVSVLALHSYLDEMKETLATYLAAYKRDPSDVCKDSIPSLTDRILVLEKQKQLYGNNWMVDKQGKFFLIPVQDFDQMNVRRAKFGLGPRMKPTVYAIGENKYPLGMGMAEASDQKELTDDEYAEFSRGHLR